MTNPSTEQRELDLVEKVDFRILGVSNNEEKLQQLLKVYLPPLLLKAGSEYASVRNKVVVISQRLHTFIQPPGIVLPVAALLDQYKAAASPLLKHLDLTFIQHSVRRLEASERRSLVPKAIRGIGSDSGSTVAGLFNVLLRLLGDLRLPPRASKEDLSLREDIGLSDPKDAAFVAEWLGKLLLLRTNAAGPTASPGLSDADIAFLTLGKPDTWALSAKGLSLPETRIKVATFLTSGAFTDEERFIPAIYAAASGDSRVSELGDDMLKRSAISLEDPALIKKLFQAHSKLPAPYRIRILGLLSKSEIATTFTDEILATFRQNVASQATESSDAMQIDGQPPSRKAAGLEQTKVHRALFEYINWVARIGSKKTDFNRIGPPLVQLLRDFIQDQGWPKPESQSLDDITLRSRAYETIGVLAKGTSMPTDDRLSLTSWLFRSLAEDPTPDVVVNIDGALSSLTSIFKPPLEPTTHERLRSILLMYMVQQGEEDGGSSDIVRSARHAATKWANNCLPFSDISARWIDILAVAGRRDERSDVVEEGQKGLDPWTYYANDDRSTELPAWQDMVQTFFKEPMTHLSAAAPSVPGQNEGQGGMDVDEESVFRNFPGDAFIAFPVAVDYCKRILFLAALKGTFKVEPGWERQLLTLVHSDLATRQAIRTYFASESAYGRSVSDLLHAAFEGMIKENARVAEKCARSFVDIASFVPRAVLEPLVSRSVELLPLVTSNRKEFRALGAKAFGILAAHPKNGAEAVAKSKAALVNVTQTLKTAIGSDLNAVEGAFLALAHLASRLVYYSAETKDEVVGDLGEIFPTLDSISSSSVSTQEALFEAYAQLWTAGIQTFPAAEKEKDSHKEFITKAFIDPLVLHAKKGNEKAITALGRLAISLPVTDAAATDKSPDDDILALVLEKLYALYEIKQAEVHFAVGEAITAAIACWDAEVVQITADVQADSGDAYRVHKRASRITTVLEKLLVDCKTTKPSLLKASGIWLFCIIQHCSHLEEIQRRLRQCQVAFMRLLSARDELVQETASRGLALVYEKGDPELKGELVRDLVSSFTGSGPQLKVDDETELFDAGALPTGEGKSITSYKDIVSLANEVGDQSLVYKFMSLATNAATWSTRSAFGRFGLSNILSESEIDPKLYPKLYRYRFDPNQNVQKSMNDIWKALVKDSNTVLETHFDAIMRDLLKSILTKEWRVREASCAAISDLISGRPFPKYEPYYKDIWTAALKVLDDVKSTVRNAALHLCIALSTTLVRQLEDSGSTASATVMMNEALPFLLSDKGIESGVEDVKLFATITVIKIAKSGGKSLNPYIPTMVPNLLGILSTIEPEAINYHYQRAGEDNREKIDRLRSTMVSQSPISEAIENCLRSVDGDVMRELAPGLEEAVKSAVGMPTKIGCSRVLTTLATRHGNNFKPYAARFLQLMERVALERNDEVSQGYARAAAYIMRVAPDDARLKWVAKVRKLYMESEDETRRQKVADCVLAVSKISPDVFGELEAGLLPFAFLGKNDTDEYVGKGFGEVWDKQAGSGISVTRWVREIVELCDKALGTHQWALKHAGALAIAEAVGAVTGAGDLMGVVNLENLRMLWPVYEKALGLKTFEGKEKLLERFPGFVAKTKGVWGEEKLGETLRKIAVREAKRNNAEYRPHALKCLWGFAEAREDLDVLGEIGGIVTPFLAEMVEAEAEADKMDVDEKKKTAANNAGRGLDSKSKTAWAAIEAVAKGYNRGRMAKGGKEAWGQLRRVVEVLEENASGKGKKGLELESPYIARAEFDTIRRGYWYECVTELLEAALKGSGNSAAENVEAGEVEILKWYLATLDIDKADAGTEDQRLARTKAVGAVLKLWKTQQAGEGETMKETRRVVKEAMAKALREERSLEVQRGWRDALGLL
ncbi:proteasome stabiliser-domain-containing protein [Bombardia bombarda]|uniref:Proteasome stabiliser-domain-containing protein n=1 Tax=Bombardia bombarda TaxID=252184 RepID=A0AA40C599_9PEZI|nr:proteasome stabiliser-domain-containing protein [Bombardia bombarda]